MVKTCWNNKRHYKPIPGDWLAWLQSVQEAVAGVYLGNNNPIKGNKKEPRRGDRRLPKIT